MKAGRAGAVVVVHAHGDRTHAADCFVVRARPKPGTRSGPWYPIPARFVAPNVTRCAHCRGGR